MDPFAGRRLDTVTKGDLLNLIDRGEPESIFLDYKRDIEIILPPSQSSQQKQNRKEFLRDVTAFANSRGGLLVYGMEEERDADNKRTGMPDDLCGVSHSNGGDLRSVIDDLIRNGIDEPPYGHVEVAAPDIGNGKLALLVRVPASLRAPHMVKLDGERRFYRRVNTGNEPMTASQVRDVVLQSASIEERIAQTIEKRRAVWLQMLPDSPFLAMHLVPLMHDPRRIDVTRDDVIKRLRRDQPPWPGSGDFREWRGSHRLEGFQIEDNPRAVGGGAYDDFWARIIFHRGGMVEYVDRYIMRPNSPNLYLWNSVEDTVHTAMNSLLGLFSDGTLPMPFAISVSLENVGKKVWAVSQFGALIQGKTLPSRIAPEPVIVNDLSGDFRALVRPIWDVVWNAGGQPRCKGYDAYGVYKGYDK